MRIVCCEESRSLRLASCCSVEVMNGAAGLRVYGFSSTDVTLNAAPSSFAGEVACVGLGELHGVLRLQRAVLAEVATLCDALAVDRREPGGERAGVERRDDVPVLGRDERHALALALDDEPRRDRLHAPGGEPLHDLPPEHRRDLVAVETVEDPPRLLRVDEAACRCRASRPARARSPGA